MPTLNVLDFLNHRVDLIQSYCPNIHLKIIPADQESCNSNQDILPKRIGENWIRSQLESENTTIAVWSGVACGRRLLTVPHDEHGINQVLKRLEGRQHQVIMMIGHQLQGKISIKTSVARIKFKRLSDHERKSFIADPSRWQGRLGGYIGLDRNVSLCKAINGDPSALYGFSMYQLNNLIQSKFPE